MKLIGGEIDGGAEARGVEVDVGGLVRGKQVGKPGVAIGAGHVEGGPPEPIDQVGVRPSLEQRLACADVILCARASRASCGRSDG